MRSPAWNRSDLVGRQFGRLTVLRPADRRAAQLLWVCSCSCGGQTETTATKLRSGHSKSCGCNRRRRGADHPNTDPRSVLERIRARTFVNHRTGCWEWQGSKGDKFGYGNMRVGEGTMLVHRAAWIEINGPIPDGLGCLHRCDNPPCWNPDHLFLGTRADNNADPDRKGRHIALKGEDHGCAVLTEDEIRAIRAIPEYRGAATEAAKRFGISIGHACKIRNGESWGHVR